jgi:hypothetical protein
MAGKGPGAEYPVWNGWDRKADFPKMIHCLLFGGQFFVPRSGQSACPQTAIRKLGVVAITHLFEVARRAGMFEQSVALSPHLLQEAALFYSSQGYSKATRQNSDRTF